MDGIPTLEVGFAIDTGGSFESLSHLDNAIDRATVNAVQEFAKIEQASGSMLNLGGATASIKTFGSAATRELQATAREMAQAEKAGEAMVRQLDRQNDAFGRTREELRSTKAEAAAYRAEQVGLLELAQRIRASEEELYGKQLFAARQAAIARENAAEDAADAEVRAQRRVMDELRARAQLEDLLYRNFSVGREPATKGGATLFALAARERELEVVERQTLAERALSDARRAGEAAQRQQINMLAERANLEAALSRIDGRDRGRAADAGASFSALAAREAEAEARAHDQAAAAAARHANEHSLLAAAVRGSHAAQMADADAAERLRMATDPLYAATKRLNAEIAESTRLYLAGSTAPAEYARQQDVLNGRLRQTIATHNAHAAAAGKNGFALTQLSFQINDVATMAAMGAPPMQIFASQAGQIYQVFQMADGGAKGFAKQLGGLALRFAPLIAVAGAGVAGLALFQRSVASGIDTDAMVAGLGLTRAEIKRLENTAVSTGDVVTATFQVLAENVGLNMGAMNSFFGDAMDWLTMVGRRTLAALLTMFTGTFKAIGAIVRGVFSGKGIGDILADVDAAFASQNDRWNEKLKEFGSDVTDRVAANKLADLRRQAEELKLDRTPKKPKVDRHAENLAREIAATEAQIRNLHALADAYGVSSAAALIAEARVKAESAAIKKRADVEAMVNRQVRLSIAERVSEAAQGSAEMREQATVQAEVNAMIAEGLIPSERAADLVRDRIAQLPLLAAIEAAQQRGLTADAERATKALDAQRAAQDAANAAASGQRFVAADVEAERRLATLREELRLVGATDEARTAALAKLKAEQEAVAMGGTLGTPYADEYVRKQVQIAVETARIAAAQRDWNDALSFAADRWDLIARNVQNAAQGMASAFGDVGGAIGDVAAIYAGFSAQRARADEQHEAAMRVATTQAAIDRENARHALATSTAQVGLFGDMASAAKGFFSEKSRGYRMMQDAEKAFRAVEFALSVRAMAQDLAETGSKIASSVARTAVMATEAVVRAIRDLPFPLNLAAGAATAAAIAALGVSVVGSFGGGGKNTLTPTNSGTGTVLGDGEAQSESIKRSIDALREVDTTTSIYARQMAGSLRSIENQIGSVAALVVRAGDVDASAGVREGFKPNVVGSVLGAIPLVGGLLGSLFGSSTSVVANGLFGKAQSLGDILGQGFDASYFSDVKKTSKFLGIKTGTSYSTKYGAADAGLEAQFTMILRGFSDAIAASAEPLGAATDEVQRRLNGFVVDIGKVDLKGLTGAQIEEKLAAVFGAAADRMADAAFPGIARFAQVGEGAFETLVRVASTVEAVTTALGSLGNAAQGMGIDAKLALAGQFDSVGDLTGAVQSYFDAFYSRQEQAAAKGEQLGRVFESMGLAMPTTLAGFRALVDAQDLTTEAGRSTYATLLKLAPAFAELQAAMDGARSAADILAERADLERKLLELRGDTAALRALELAKVDASNRDLLRQVWAMQDAQEAAKAADQLRQAWSSVGDGIMAEVRRIRGLTDDAGGNNFAMLQGQFNATSEAARAGDQDAAKLLPGLSQSLLAAAALVATSRQELRRVQAQTATSLETTYSAIAAMTGAVPAKADAATIAASAAAGNASAQRPAADAAAEIRALRDEVAQLRQENNAGHAATAGNAGRVARRLDDVTTASGGDAISVVKAA